MSLDIFQNDATAALADASNRIAPDLPMGFSDALSTSWRYMTDWHSSVAYQASKEQALAQYGDDVFGRTGERLPTTALGEGLITTDDFNAKVAGINEKYPVNLPLLSDDDVNAMALKQMTAAKRAGDEMSGREKTLGGYLGSIIGTIGGGLADPIAAMTLPLGGAGELGILGRALEFGAISASTEGAVAASSYQAHEAAVPGSTKGMAGEIATAGLFGAALGGAFGALGKWLRAGENPLPTSVRDEVNAATSEAQINATNIFPTAEGEIAGRDAAARAVAQAARGEPINVADGFDPAHVRAFGETVSATTPDELAAAGDRALRPLTHDVVPDVEHFDAIPGPFDDAAAYWESRLADASPEERAAFGATDVPEIAAPSLTPEQTTALAAEPATADAVQKALIDYRVANPDAEFTTQIARPDGTFEFQTRKLSEVMDEIDAQESLGRELLTCAVGGVAE